MTKHKGYETLDLVHLISHPNPNTRNGICSTAAE